MKALLPVVFANGTPGGGSREDTSFSDWKSVEKNDSPDVVNQNPNAAGVLKPEDDKIKMTLKHRHRPAKARKPQTPDGTVGSEIHRDMGRENFGGAPDSYQQPFDQPSPSSKEYYYAPGDHGITSRRVNAEAIPVLYEDRVEENQDSQHFYNREQDSNFSQDPRTWRFRKDDKDLSLDPGKQGKQDAEEAMDWSVVEQGEMELPLDAARRLPRLIFAKPEVAEAPASAGSEKVKDMSFGHPEYVGKIGGTDAFQVAVYPEMEAQTPDYWLFMFMNKSGSTYKLAPAYSIDFFDKARAEAGEKIEDDLKEAIFNALPKEVVSNAKAELTGEKPTAPAKATGREAKKPDPQAEKIKKEEQDLKKQGLELKKKQLEMKRQEQQMKEQELKKKQDLQQVKLQTQDLKQQRELEKQQKMREKLERSSEKGSPHEVPAKPATSAKPGEKADNKEGAKYTDEGGKGNVFTDTKLDEAAPELTQVEKLFSTIKSWDDNNAFVDPTKLDAGAVAALEAKPKGEGKYFDWIYVSPKEAERQAKNLAKGQEPPRSILWVYKHPAWDEVAMKIEKQKKRAAKPRVKV
jgi:hypothetical protein